MSPFDDETMKILNDPKAINIALALSAAGQQASRDMVGSPLVIFVAIGILAGGIADRMVEEGHLTREDAEAALDLMNFAAARFSETMEKAI